MIKELNAKGMSQRDIAGSVGVSKGTVQAVLNQSGQNDRNGETVQSEEIGEKNEHDAQTVQSGESPSVFTHATSVTPIANLNTN